MDCLQFSSHTLNVSEQRHSPLRVATPSTDVFVDLICRRPACPRPVPEVPRGRPRLFCSDACRKGFSREAQRARATLMRVQAVVVQYESSSPQDHTVSLNDQPAAVPPLVQPQLSQTLLHEASALANVRMLVDELSLLVDRGEYEGQPLSAAVVMARLRAALSATSNE